MNKENLGDYLRDHLAGSVAGIELLRHLAEAAPSPTERSILEDLHREVETDQTTLKELLAGLDLSESMIKKAGAWLAEKALMLKAHGTAEPLGRLEALEVILLGVQGKHSLWKALAELPPADSWPDLQELKSRARNQMQVLETLRLEAVRMAFA